jgi:hypothetical protein
MKDQADILAELSTAQATITSLRAENANLKSNAGNASRPDLEAAISALTEERDTLKAANELFKFQVRDFDKAVAEQVAALGITRPGPGIASSATGGTTRNLTSECMAANAMKSAEAAS